MIEVRQKKEDSGSLYNKLLLSLFFFLGVAFYPIYLPMLILLFVALLIKERQVRFKNSLLALWFLLTLSVLLPIFISLFDSVDQTNITTFVSIFIRISIGLYVFSRLNDEQRWLALKLFLLGMFFNSFLIASSSYLFFDSAVVGYGQAYHPLYGVFINTPLVSNALVPFTAVAINKIFKSPKPSRLLIYIAFIVISILCGLFFGGRTYFILVGLVTLFNLFIYFNFKVILTLLVISLVAYVGIETFNINEYPAIKFAVDRFESKKLAEDPRVERYVDGFVKLFKSPVGRFYMDVRFGGNDKFHNVFLDFSKYGGWLIFFSMSILFFLPLIKIFHVKDKREIFGLYLVLFLILQQDVFTGSGFVVYYGFILLASHLIFLNSNDEGQTRLWRKPC